MKCPKKWYFLFYECAIYRIKSKVAYLGQFFADLDEIWYKSRATQVVSTHQISSWSDEKWQRYGTCSVSQGRRGPSNWVSKMNLLKAGGHSFWPRKLIFGYVVAQCIYPKAHYYLLLIKSLVWPWQGPKDDQSVPKYGVQLHFFYQDSTHESLIIVPVQWKKPYPNLLQYLSIRTVTDGFYEFAC